MHELIITLLFSILWNFFDLDKTSDGGVFEVTASPNPSSKLNCDHFFGLSAPLLLKIWA